MRKRVRQDLPIIVLGLTGYISRGRKAKDIEQAVRQLSPAEAGLHIVVDLQRVTGIQRIWFPSLLAATLTTRDRGRRLIIVGVTAEIKRLFQETRLEPHFEFAADVKEAAEWIRQLEAVPTSR